MRELYLVSAPVPGGHYGKAQSHARPGQVSGDGIPEQVHGVGPRQVAGGVWDNLTGNCFAVDFLQIPIATNFIESCR